MLERLESPSWNLAAPAEQPHVAALPAARIPAAYQPKVSVLNI